MWPKNYGGGGGGMYLQWIQPWKRKRFPEYTRKKNKLLVGYSKNPRIFLGFPWKFASCCLSFESFMRLDLSQQPLLQYFSLVLCSVSAFLFMWGKPGCRLAMLAGSCTVWSMASSLMDKCLLTKPSAEETIPSTLSSVRLVLGSMSHELFSWI